MSELVVNALRFHVQTLRGPHGGARPPVVMVHGLTVDLSSFYVTIAGAVAVESDVYLYDLRGHGMSEVPPCHYGISDHVADLVGLIDSWGIDEPVHLFANSFGCIVALFFAHYYPERVASLFLIEPHLSEEGWGLRMADAIREFGGDSDEVDRFVEGNPAKLRWVRRTEILLRKTSILDDLAKDPHVSDEWLEDLRCPVFSMYGSDSDAVDRATARDRHIPGCQPCIVPGGTHMLLAEAGVLIRDHAVEWIRDHNSARAR